MRIGIVHAAFRQPLGGGERYTLRLVGSLRDRGHDVAVATAFAERESVRSMEGAELFILPVRTLYRPGGTQRPKTPIRAAWHAMDVYNPSVVPWLRSFLRDHKPHVVHTQSFQGLSGAVFPELAQHSHIHTVHDCSLLDPNTTLVDGSGTLRDHLPPPWRWRAQMLARLMRASAVVFPSRRVLELHRRLGWHPRGARVEVVPHGWSIPTAPRKPSKRGRALRILYMGRLTSVKGFDTLLAAWGAEGIPEAELVIAGDGPLRRSAERLSEGSPRVRYVGWASEELKARLFHDADALVFPSSSAEGFGLSCAEALLSGIPVLVSAVAQPDFIEDGKNGLVVRDDAAAWRDALARLVRDRALLGSLSAGARHSAKQLDWETHVDRIERLYEEVAA